MRIVLFVIFATAALLACTAQEFQALRPVLFEAAKTVAVKSTESFLASATLVQAGTFETTVAPYYTRLDLQLKRAERAVTTGAIPKYAGSRILYLGHAAQEKIRAAWRENQDTPTARQALAEASALMAEIDALLNRGLKWRP